MAIDLQSPLDDFLERTSQIRRIVSAIESASKTPTILTTTRTGVDLSRISMPTENTVNAMSLVFLASSFEEFVREEIGQCADLMITRYLHVSSETKATIRSAYWEAALGAFKYKRAILAKKVNKSDPRSIDARLLGELQPLLESVAAFVSRDDPTQILRDLFSQHSNNFRPNVVTEIGARLNIQDIIGKIGDTARIKRITNEAKRADSAKKLWATMDDFYTRRNKIVHSLSPGTGFGVNILIADVELLEAVAASMKDVLGTETAAW